MTRLSDSCYLTNGLIVDGLRHKAFRGGLLFKGGVIRKIVRENGEAGHGAPPADPAEPAFGSYTLPAGAALPATEVIDVHGAYITPGFIDIHRHGDWLALKGWESGDDRLLNCQGITSVVNGNCGLSCAPLGEKYQKEILTLLEPVTGFPPEGGDTAGTASTFPSYMKALAASKRSVNTGMLLGNGTTRAAVAGYRPGALEPDEVHAIWHHIESALASGALGVSLGLAYAPEFEYVRESLIEALKPLAGTDYPITTHIRSEGDGAMEALHEVIDVARALGIPLHTSHMKCIGPRNWHVGPRRELKLIHDMADQGMTIDFDLYPYLAGSTQLFHVIPPDFQKGGADVFIENLKNPSFRAAMTETLKKPSEDFENIIELVGFSNIVTSSLHSDAWKKYVGWTIEAIARDRHADPYNTLYSILAAEHCDVTMFDTIACDEDIVTFLSDPLACLISDSIYPRDGLPHPRVYGTFPHFLIDYVFRRPLFSIEDAIWKMTARPAEVLHLDRGVLKEGFPADICVFHPEDLRAPATYDSPRQFSGGMSYVFVNGKKVIDQGTWIGGDAGCVLERS